MNASFLQFSNKFHHFGCFNVYQAKMVFPNMDKGNLSRWAANGMLVRLRQDWYAFPDMINVNNFARYIAERIYRPSYISLHTALSYYGIIPEAVVAITSVSTHKTTKFENQFAQYTYQKIKPQLFFGYEPKSIAGDFNTDRRSFMLAHPEKAILDLLYLYPEYKTEEDMLELRFDDYFMQEDLDIKRLEKYQEKFANKALDNRIKTLRNTYGI